MDGVEEKLQAKGAVQIFGEKSRIELTCKSTGQAPNFDPQNPPGWVIKPDLPVIRKIFPDIEKGYNEMKVGF